MFVARVTADVDALQQFMEWGGIALDHLAASRSSARSPLMLVFSWQLALAVVGAGDPAGPDRLVDAGAAVGGVQHRADARRRDALGGLRVRDGRGGRARLRAGRADARPGRAARSTARYQAEVVAHFRAATLWPLSTVFYALAVSIVVVLGAVFGPDVGTHVRSGHGVPVPRRRRSCTCSPTSPRSTARRRPRSRAGGRSWRSSTCRSRSWSRCPASSCPRARSRSRAEDVEYRYREGGRGAARDLARRRRPAPTSRSSGETGCGKTTFVKLLSRLADPSRGRIVIGGVDLREVAAGVAASSDPDGAAGRVPVRHDGARERAGRARGRDRPRRRDRVRGARARRTGSRRCPTGSTRGSASAARRCPSASASSSRWCARSSATPGLLILDEATSAVDPATERRITEALRRVSEGRTTVTIAHRLSTAEAADQVFVFDAGRLVEKGTHAELVRRRRHVRALYESWLGNIRVELSAT